MILECNEWNLGYSQIRRDCRADDDGNPGSTLIVSNADVDAMCAARILSYMLRADGVSYTLLPCMSHSQLRKILAHKKADDVRAVVLLNLGATRNLTKLFDGDVGAGADADSPDASDDDDDDEQGQRQPKPTPVNLDPSVKLYVMDFRRPVHLANIHAGENVVVFFEGVENGAVPDLPSDGDNLSGNESSSSSEDDDEEEDEDESSADEGEREFDDQDEGENEFGAEDGADKDDDPTTSKDKRVLVEAAGGNGEEQETDYDGDREDDDGERSRSKKMRTDDDDDASEGDDKVPEGEGSQAQSQSQQQPPATMPSLTPRELHQQRRDRLRLYYTSGTFHGSPAASVAHRIATQLRFGEVGDLLWLACVGVTDAYLHCRLDVAGYTALAMNLRRHCNRLYPNDMYHRVENAAYAEHLTGAATANNHRSADSQELTKIGFSESGRILSEDDFRFFLLRHTTLYNAMMLSDFVSTRLQLNTAKGRDRLLELLAKMGYPLEECHQPFAFMKPSLRRRLPERMRQHSEEYGLDNFEYTSFFRVTGYQSLLSAADTSYAITALLECNRPAAATKSSDGDTVVISDESDVVESELLQSFNYAYDALNANEAPSVGLNGLTGEGTNLGTLVNGGNLSGGNGLGAGIRLAMAVQSTIIQTAKNLMERSAITRLDHFRYAYITCTSQGDKEAAANDSVPAGQSTSEDDQKQQNHIFSKPLALTRLAHYLIDLNRVNGKWTGANASPMVLVLLAEKPRTKSYLVVAYEYAAEAGHFVKNRFGKNFELAAQSMQGAFLFDSFDTNVVEVAASDVQRFIEQLHYLMESM